MTRRQSGARGSVGVLALLALSASGAWAQQSSPSSAAPTFSKDVAPIFQRSCDTCHRPGSLGPMSLLTYQEARPWARSIRNKVSLREMPPWYIDKHVGIQRFQDDPSLTDAEVNTIVKWADAGAPQGNPADMPAPPKFEDLGLWHIGKPDVIVTMPKDLIVAAAAPDQWKDVIVDPGLTEDRWLKAVETKPSKGFRVVHHSVQNMIAPNDDGTPSADGGRGTLINEYALGKNADIFPEGTARLIKAGSKVNFNLHLHSIGEETAANVELGLKFYPKGYQPKYVADIVPVAGSELDIPPNTDNVRVDSYGTLTKPARLLSFQPHMHNRGKALCVEAILPGNSLGSIDRGGNKVVPLSCVDRYQFAWHISYHYAEDAQPLLPAGTILHVTAWHNNTVSNKFNPDPDQHVTFGNRTVDDMSFAWMKLVYLTDDQYKEALAERQAKLAATQQQQ